MKGTDIAFAVVEIPYEKYRLMPEDKKKAFQASMNLAEPKYYEHKALKKNLNDIAVVAGYPAFTYAKKSMA